MSEEDKEFLKKYDAEKFKRPSVTVDILVFTIKDEKLKVLLIKRGTPPFKDKWAIPGGFVGFEEDLEEAAFRELFEETHVKGIKLEQLHTFGEPGRDPRTRVITVAYIALISSENIKLLSRADAADAGWFSIRETPELAFDHNKILGFGLSWLRENLEKTNISFQLLPKYFTLTELQNVYETVLDKKLDKRNFRKRILALGIVEKTKMNKTGVHRPAKMFMFKN